MLTVDEIRSRLRTGEDSYTEFKERIENPESIAGEIVAFANTEGGYLLVGVTDKGAIAGVVNPTQTAMLLTQICRENILPPLLPLIETVEIETEPDFEIIGEEFVARLYSNMLDFEK